MQNNRNKRSPGEIYYKGGVEFTVLEDGTLSARWFPPKEVVGDGPRRRTQAKTFRTEREAFAARDEAKVYRIVPGGNSNIRYLEFATEVLSGRHTGIREQGAEAYLAKTKGPRISPLHYRKVKDIDVDTIRRLVLEPMKRDNCKPNYIGGVLTAIRTVLNFAVIDKIIPINPVALLVPQEIPKEKGGQKRMVVITQEDFDRLYRAVSPKYKLYVQLLFFTGLRNSEACGLVWEDIDFDKNKIRVEAQRASKGMIRVEVKTRNSVRAIDLGPTLRLSLLNHKITVPHEPEDWVFPDITQGSAGAHLWRVRQSLGSPFDGSDGEIAFSPHKARHAVCTALMSKLSVTEAIEQTGNSANTLLGVYTHATESDGKVGSVLEQAFGEASDQ